MHHGAVGVVGAALLATAILAGAGPRSWAEGAIAVGSTGDVVKDGIAFGMIVNEPKGKAAETAVKRCRTFKAKAAAGRCKVVATFSGECFAVAYDPKSGTPGAGWGVGPDQQAANLKAIVMCEETAGRARKGFCQVESGGCDTTSQAKAAQQEAPKIALPGPAKPLTAADLETPAARKTLRKVEEQSPKLDMSPPVLLLFAMAIAGIAYVASQFLKGRAK